MPTLSLRLVKLYGNGNDNRKTSTFDAYFIEYFEIFS